MTNNLNSVIVEGNLTKDAEFDSTQKGTGFCTFSVATNRYFKSGEEIQHEVSYFDVEAWGKLADSCRGMLTKGFGVRVVGRLKQDRWNSDDGKAKSRVKIVAEHIEAKPVTATEKEVAADSGADETKPEAKPARQKKAQKEKELIMA
ncbi:MAG: single-stranded DNA-binding protein [Spirochaetia bacterium]|nr:single-stranded DNA-binding protein [Spirochaetia bacterium]MBR0318865.1 single-stranded DNA-binding protein [Spirochaetia bacterium]